MLRIRVRLLSVSPAVVGTSSASTLRRRRRSTEEAGVLECLVARSEVDRDPLTEDIDIEMGASWTPTAAATTRGLSAMSSRAPSNFSTSEQNAALNAARNLFPVTQ